ncbi:hypothetical protein [Hyalangium rubrum]|uniref:Uncharacterized protein n=1 Tax=Hyalangium rubrum TaxID=3103134 RepID=A0ABU5HAJ9_9BACT|nr:hypothetical protein [Hyalangium sp. s54d21]MDY7230495.1 hypothetical protein [Hyalangium sp. s54d21]
MRRRILIVLLALGTVGGYASGIASLRYRSHCRRAWMEARTPHQCPPCSGSAEAPAPPGPR